MIPTQRLWVALCALSLPAVAAGFMPDLWTAIAGLDLLLLALAVHTSGMKPAATAGRLSARSATQRRWVGVTWGPRPRPSLP